MTASLAIWLGSVGAFAGREVAAPACAQSIASAGGTVVAERGQAWNWEGYRDYLVTLGGETGPDQRICVDVAPASHGYFLREVAKYAPALVSRLTLGAGTRGTLHAWWWIAGPPQAPALPQVPVAAVPPVQPPAPGGRSWPSIDGRLATGSKAPKDSVVAIGLEDYAYVADVPNARADAEAFGSTAIYTLGVPVDRVQVLKSGSVDHLRAALVRAGKETAAGGRVWVFFAGHGAASLTTRQRVLLGDDVRADELSFDTRSLPVDEVVNLAGAGGGQPVLVLDTCFTGVGRGGGELIAGKRFAVPSAAVAQGSAATVFSAASANETATALDGAGHGAFTYFVVGGMRGWADGELDGVRDGAVSTDELRTYVARALRASGLRTQNPEWVSPGPAGAWTTGATETGPAFQ